MAAFGTALEEAGEIDPQVSLLQYVKQTGALPTLGNFPFESDQVIRFRLRLKGSYRYFVTITGLDDLYLGINQDTFIERRKMPGQLFPQ